MGKRTAQVHTSLDPKDVKDFLDGVAAACLQAYPEVQDIMDNTTIIKDIQNAIDKNCKNMRQPVAMTCILTFASALLDHATIGCIHEGQDGTIQSISLNENHQGD